MLDEFGSQMLSIVLVICFIGIAISIFLLVIRAFIGPSNADRAVAIDTIGANMMAFTGLAAIGLVTDKLNDVVLLIGILLFIGTIATAKFIEKGVIIDRHNH
ncbi:monovalent cation/H+ antiporter complex subunit F [Tenuibacillus multivorans]|uniref:Multicomponent Na+:H+ antiporter subunit F n=1 Tax=Tenuibacillus multivorans TaxID=237069 RepID=A0A1G9ZHB3_9BACI|nr:monovalent cation/H+ antiporter complex subunit F [Tenuibacillus multivorans]GEL77511.1 Na(+)/H(+) antiporter subunit F [Tenuibacillus multivorans]SDN20431.1 multicomponent Na+:H+ antiporter subunit F [Tenuibacillus multivorans]